MSRRHQTRLYPDQLSVCLYTSNGELWYFQRRIKHNCVASARKIERLDLGTLQAGSRCKSESLSFSLPHWSPHHGRQAYLFLCLHILQALPCCHRDSTLFPKCEWAFCYNPFAGLACVVHMSCSSPPSSGLHVSANHKLSS